MGVGWGLDRHGVEVALWSNWGSGGVGVRNTVAGVARRVRPRRQERMKVGVGLTGGEVSQVEWG